MGGWSRPCGLCEVVGSAAGSQLGRGSAWGGGEGKAPLTANRPLPTAGLPSQEGAAQSHLCSGDRDEQGSPRKEAPAFPKVQRLSPRGSGLLLSPPRQSGSGGNLAPARTWKWPLSLCLWHRRKRTRRTNWSVLLQCSLGWTWGQCQEQGISKRTAPNCPQKRRAQGKAGKAEKSREDRWKGGSCRLSHWLSPTRTPTPTPGAESTA